jgi:hypothetical protein
MIWEMELMLRKIEKKQVVLKKALATTNDTMSNIMTTPTTTLKP